MAVSLTPEEQARVNSVIAEKDEEAADFTNVSDQLALEKAQLQLDEDIYTKFRDDAYAQIFALLDAEVTALDAEVTLCPTCGRVPDPFETTKNES